MNASRANKVHNNDSKLMRVCVSKIKVRQVWGFNPVTRTKPSKKLYKRTRYVYNGN